MRYARPRPRLPETLGRYKSSTDQRLQHGSNSAMLMTQVKLPGGACSTTPTQHRRRGVPVQYPGAQSQRLSPGDCQRAARAEGARKQLRAAGKTVHPSTNCVIFRPARSRRCPTPHRPSRCPTSRSPDIAGQELAGQITVRNQDLLTFSASMTLSTVARGRITDGGGAQEDGDRLGVDRDDRDRITLTLRELSAIVISAWAALTPRRR